MSLDYIWFLFHSSSFERFWSEALELCLTFTALTLKLL